MIIRPYILLLACMLVHIHGMADKIRVGKGRQIQSIRNALTICKPYDTIEVERGSYHENDLLIDKPVTLIGINSPLINGNNKGNLIVIRSKDVRINGFRLVNSGRSSVKDFAGVRIENSAYVSVQNCMVYNCYFGIFILNSENCLVSGNTVKGEAVNETTSGNGIHLWKSKRITVSGNNLSKNRDGIYLEFAEQCVIQNNFSKGNIRYGLHFMFSHGNQYKKNHFSQNGAGVAVMYTQHVEMTENIFEDNWGTASYGLLLKDISNSKIYHNKFLGNTVGIYMEGVKNVSVCNNSFEANGWGMKLLGNCVDDTISYNNFDNNTFDLVTNSFSPSNTNVLSRNYWDRYHGYDLNKDQLGDVPFRPVSLFSVYVERIPNSIVLLRTFLITLLDSIEQALPAVIPETLVDTDPLMKKHIP